MRLIVMIAGVLMIIISSCGVSPETVDLVRNNQSAYQIVVSVNSDSLSKVAGSELQEIIQKVTDATIPINHQKQSTGKQILIGKEWIDTSARIDTLDEDGFIIQVTKNNIVLAGNNGKANLYAVNTFLEKYTGCTMLSPTEYYIPQNKNIEVPLGEIFYEPDFNLRKLCFDNDEFHDYKNWNKLEDLDEWGLFVHTFQHLIPPEKYYDSHPEYFSLVGSHRLKDGQLCLSNPGTIQTLIANLRERMEEHPEMKYWSVSQNDCFNYCECEECKALYEKYETISGAYIHMANQIAQEFPDKVISTLAYNFTRSAPKNIRPLPNVNIMFCSIECNRSMPLEEDKRSADFVKDMKDWSELSDNIFAWDYVVQFKNYLTPFPNFNVLQKNLQFFKKHGVKIMFEQGSGHNWSDLNELKQYLLSKLMWDVDANADSIINDFITKYYGEAAPYIKSYFELTHQNLNKYKEEERLDIYGYPADYLDSYLQPGYLKEYKKIMDQAEEAVNNDSVYLKRVRRARLAVDFAYLDIALNKEPEGMSYLDRSGDEITIRQDMLDYLDRYTENSVATGAVNINERLFKTKDYRTYVLNKLHRITAPNKAKGKSVEILTEYSEKYPVGGGKALNDGVVGELDFHQKWLGFEGHDMIAVVDLEKSQEVKQVSMNFLKAINSWTFLPIEVEVEGSVDGVNYIQLGSVKTTDTDRGFLVQSIPYTIVFNTTSVRYIKVTASSLKQCPQWHRGYGNPCFMFVDELIVE
ncbi:DUF4838 domain-containing protein [Carboxylicivirga linearis]|uniref:DUF4838 domain-containing protein n=1 Tax=Carboxylicivirga linearis TaxID=1628157 RepID=A0ABS5K172_9BACT|nr:DUF4838 domain-containing protein [Carboxylicivirga linearis]MBS2100917.1 DUF4838 domain-containing protein [Carboxylicivirga linearis]